MTGHSCNQIRPLPGQCRPILLLAVIGLILGMTGCADAIADVLHPRNELRGGESPQEVFEVYQNALLQYHWLVSIDCLVKDDQERLIREAVSQGMVRRSNIEFAAIMERHGIGKEFFESRLKAASSGATKPTLTRTDIVGSIEQGPVFYADIQRCIMKQFFERVERAGNPLGNRREVRRIPELDDVQISGAFAKGTIYRTSILGLREQPVGFERIDGRWFVDEILPGEEEEDQILGR